MTSAWINPHFLIFSQILLPTRELTPENWLIYMQNLRINQIFASNSRNNSIYSETLYRHAFSFGPFVRLILSSSQRPQFSSQPSPKRACPRVRQAPAPNLFSQKGSETLSTAAKNPQKSNKKRAQGDSNESLWTLKFYSETYLNAALKGTKLGAELGRFWVGRGQGDPEKFICCRNYNISRSKYQVKFVWPVIFKI